MRVLFLTQYDINGPSSRIRVYQFLPFFEERGVQCTVKPLITGPVKEMLTILLGSKKKWPRIKVCLKIIWCFICRYPEVFSARAYDVVIVQKDVLPFGLYYLLRIVNSNFIYEFDDAIWESSPGVNDKSLILRIIFWYRRRCFLRLVKNAKLVMAENSYLEKFSRRYNNKVEVISAPINTSKYYPTNAKEDSKIVLGWLGSPMTSYLLELIKEPITVLSKQIENLEFHNIAGLPIAWPGVKVKNLPFLEEKEVEYLSAFDIGLMPLDNAEFNKGRLSYKMLLYASMGLPIVADDIGLNREVVKNGINGFLVSGSNDWVEKLLLLIKNKDLREKMGKEARLLAVNKYDLSVCAEKYVKIVNELSKYVRR